jgi:hypothetical protein
MSTANNRKSMRGQSCAACDGPLGEDALFGFYVSPGNEQLFPHYICGRCAGDDLAHVAELIELRFMPAEGKA